METLIMDDVKLSEDTQTSIQHEVGSYFIFSFLERYLGMLFCYWFNSGCLYYYECNDQLTVSQFHLVFYAACMMQSVLWYVYLIMLMWMLLKIHMLKSIWIAESNWWCFLSILLLGNYLVDWNGSFCFGMSTTLLPCVVETYISIILSVINGSMKQCDTAFLISLAGLLFIAQLSFLHHFFFKPYWNIMLKTYVSVHCR